MPSSKYTINCDLGEGMTNESSVIPFIDIASVACGGHFGDHETIGKTLQLIREFRKKAGCHPSYPDRENFGRKSLLIQPEVLLQSIWAQISLFLEIAELENASLDHIKFHGALYNDAAENHELAVLLVDFLKNRLPQTPLFVPPHSEIEKAATKARLPIRLEVFADRAYQENYKLVNRTEENSLLTQKKQVIPHLKSILDHGEIRTNTGVLIPVEADTICVHGDNPGIMEFLPFVRNQFWK